MNFSNPNINNNNFSHWIFEILWPQSGFTYIGAIFTTIPITVLILVIIFGNGLVIVAVKQVRRLHQIQNWFIVSLAVSDVLVGLLIIPLTLSHEIMGFWWFGSILCELWLALDVLLSTSSILNLCVISLDRYWSVTDPINYREKRTPRRALTMIASAWILSFLISFPPLVGWRPNRQPQTCDLSTEVGYVIYSALGSFYIPTIILIIVYIKIYMITRQRMLKRLSESKVITTFRNSLRRKKDNNSGSRGRESPFLFKRKMTGQKSIKNNSARSLPTSPNELKRTNSTKKYSTVSSTKSMNKFWNFFSKKQSFTTCTETEIQSSSNEKSSKSSISNNPETHGNSDVYFDFNNLPNVNFVSINCGEDGMIKIASLKNKVVTSKSAPASSCTCTTTTSSVNCNHQTLNDDHRNSLFSVSKKISSQNGSTVADLNYSNTTYTTTKPQQETKMLQKEANRNIYKEKRQQLKRKEKRSTIILGMIMMAFILCWLPFFICYVLAAIGFKADELIFDVFFWMGYCNSALNPIIYTAFNLEFRRAFQAVLCMRSQYQKTSGSTA